MSNPQTTIIQRLKFATNPDYLAPENDYKKLCREAADEIERLQKEMEHLEEQRELDQEAADAR